MTSFKQIEYLLINNKLDNAKVMINNISDEMKDNAEFWNLKGILSLKTKKYKDAVEFLGNSIKLNYTNADALYNLGFAYDKLSNLKTAAFYYGLSYFYSNDAEFKRQLKSLFRENSNLTNVFEAAAEINKEYIDVTSKFKNEIKNVLYLGWLGHSNVGDDVLFELFKLMTYKLQLEKQMNFLINIDSLSDHKNYKIDVSSYNLIVLGGGSLLQNQHFLNICKDAINKSIPVVSWGTGVEGFYSYEHIDTIGKSIDLEMKSFLSISKDFQYISVRGPYTRNFLKNIGLENYIDVIGDPALFYAKEKFDGKLEAIADKSINRKILINWGTSFNNVLGKNEMAVENELVSVITKLIERGYEVTVYPIWNEDIIPVLRLVEKVNNNNCHAISEVLEAKLLQLLISQAFLTVNFKLHANILSAAVNRPFLSLAYRGKCFDFAKSIGCERYVIPTDDINANKLLEMISEIENNYNHIVHTIKNSKEKFHPKFINSFKIIFDLLETDNLNHINSENKQGNVLEYYSEDLQSPFLSVIKDIINMEHLNKDSIIEIIVQYSNYCSNNLQKETFKNLISVLKAYFIVKINDSALSFFLFRQLGLKGMMIEEFIGKIRKISPKTKFDKSKIEIYKKGITAFPRVSVIITTYNRKQFLLEAVNSILNQSYPNIEIIIIDDHSTDGTEEMVIRLAKTHSSIKYLRNDTRKGPSFNRQNVFNNYTNGEYVLFLDDDDYLIDIHYISKAVRFHFDHPDISYVSANVFYEIRNTRQLKPTFLNLEKVTNSEEYFINFKNERFPKPASTLTTLFKKSALHKMGISNMQMVNDDAIYLRALLVGNAGFIDEIVGTYRVHGENITFNLTSDFIIKNLNEKKNIKNLALSHLDYSKRELINWLDRVSLQTINYYFMNSARNIGDYKSIYLWVQSHCPFIIGDLDFTKIKKKSFFDISFIKLIEVSLNLVEKVLDVLPKLGASTDLSEMNFDFNECENLLTNISSSFEPIMNDIEDDLFLIHLQEVRYEFTCVCKEYLEDQLSKVSDKSINTLTSKITNLKNELEFYFVLTL